MVARLIAFLVWALAAGSAVFWALRLGSQPMPLPPNALPVSAQVGSTTAVVRMLGVAPVVANAPPPESSRFRLVGVMAPLAGTQGPGVALISVDGKPPRAYRTGARVEGDLVVQNLAQRSVSIGHTNGGGAFTLEIPPLPPPQTGVLSMAQNGEGGTAPQSPQSQPQQMPPPQAQPPMAPQGQMPPPPQPMPPQQPGGGPYIPPEGRQ